MKQEMTQKITVLGKKVILLKKNREKLSKELLETKYRKPYFELMESIRKDAESIAKEFLSEDVFIRNEDAPKMVPRIEQIFQDTGKKISYALFKVYDINLFCKILYQSSDEIWEFYGPYWKSLGMPE